MIAAAEGLRVSAELRARLADHYGAYAEALDEGRWEAWPEFFTERCIYKIIPRENYDAGLPMALIFAESRAMLADRVAALRNTMLYAPRIVRNLGAGTRVCAIEAGGMRVASSFAAFQTMLNEPTTVFLTGRTYDRVVDEAGVLRFSERICVTDATLVPASLIFPI